jgi:hypothetical protein
VYARNNPEKRVDPNGHVSLLLDGQYDPRAFRTTPQTQTVIVVLHTGNKMIVVSSTPSKTK